MELKAEITTLTSSLNNQGFQISNKIPNILLRSIP